MRKQNGFTLIEIAIVLVIIGLLLGGVLKGQELITSARVRNIASQLDGVKVAYLAFQDRYRAVPGDYTQATTNIPGAVVPCTSGGTHTCGNGKIDDVQEAIWAWNHLARAGFITGTYDGVGTTPATNNSPSNPYGGLLLIINDSAYDDNTFPPASILNVKTGGNVPSSVMAELDRKIDDGQALTGQFRSDTKTTPPYNSGDTRCITTAAPINWDAASDVKSCDGVQLL